MIEEKVICERLKDKIFSFFMEGFDYIIFTITLTDNFNRNNIRVVLKNKQVKYLEEFNEVSSKEILKLSNLYVNLRKIMQNKNQDWSQCYFYVTKDNKYYVDFVLNPYIAKDYKNSNKPSMIESFVNNFK